MGRKYPGVEPKRNTSIQISFQYQGKRCRECLKLEPTPNNLRRASLFRAQVVEAIKQGTFDYAVSFPGSKNARLMPRQVDLNDPFIMDYMRMWLDKKEQELKSSTYRVYRAIIENQIIPQLGMIRLKDLRRSDVRDWVSQLDISNKQISNIVSPLRCALQEAVQDDLLETNVLKGWQYKKYEPPKQSKIDPFTAKEQRAILEALNEQARNFVQFALWTGLRISEQIALTWDDIDFDRKRIHVNKAKTFAADAPEPPKTKAGVREVTLLPPAQEALERQLEFTGELEDRTIFHNPRQKRPWKDDQDVRECMWKPGLKRAGVRYRYPYQTRHTYASMMLSAGEPLAWVSRQMGHSTVIITASTYAKWIPSCESELGMKAVELFNKK